VLLQALHPVVARHELRKTTEDLQQTHLHLVDSVVLLLQGTLADLPLQL
jgi:hypothetical protein